MHEADVAGIESTPEPPYSGVAITSLVLSLLVCIPGAALVGLVLAAVGIAVTGPGRRRGRGVAISGLLVSLLVTILWVGGVVFAWVFLVDTIKFVMESPNQTMTAVFDADDAAVKARFDPSVGLTDEDISRFRETATSRFGSFVEVRIDESGEPVQSPDGSLVMPLRVRFESGTIDGEIELSSGWVPEFSSFFGVRRITLESEEGDKLTLGGTWVGSGVGSGGTSSTEQPDDTEPGPDS